MERAAQTVGLVAPERQIGAAMRAVAIEQAPVAELIPKQHQILAEHAHPLDRPRGHARIERRIELVEQRHRLPVATHQRAAGGAGPDAGDQFVVRGLHGALAV